MYEVTQRQDETSLWRTGRFLRGGKVCVSLPLLPCLIAPGANSEDGRENGENRQRPSSSKTVPEVCHPAGTYPAHLRYKGTPKVELPPSAVRKRCVRQSQDLIGLGF